MVFAEKGKIIKNGGSLCVAKRNALKAEAAQALFYMIVVLCGRGSYETWVICIIKRRNSEIMVVANCSF